MSNLPFTPYKDLNVVLDDHVAIVEMNRPPHNFFDMGMLSGLVDTFDQLDEVAQCRSIVLAAHGKSFCAGADFSGAGEDVTQSSRRIYERAIRMFRNKKPIVCAVHGGAIGGGLGLALVGDFRVTDENARFSANFSRLGFHPGFGLSVSLPRVIGEQQTALLMFTGRRIDGSEAVRIGLADVLAEPGEVRAQSLALAREIAVSSPLAVQSTRATLRAGYADAIERALAHEADEQAWQFKTEDFKEGISSYGERRTPVFQGK